jgi:signal transduction histidine kinase
MNTIDLDPNKECVTPANATTKWVRIGLRVVLFSGAIGLLLGLVDPAQWAIVENLVYSECIGTAIYGAYAVLRIWVMPRRRPQALFDYLIRGIVAVPVGFVVGINVAALLMGNPVGFAAMARTANLSIPITILASLCLMYYFWSSNRIADAAAANADAQRTMAEAKLRMLQAQIEPHMLFNTLANLRTLVELEPLRAQAMIDQLIVYLRGTLAASRSTSTTLEAEFAQLAAYLELMKVRMATRLAFTLDLPDALRASTVPPMLLQPLVENAIKHGLEPKIEGGSVQVIASSSQGRVQIEVRDDGIGLSSDVADTGYGLEHVRERLRTLYGDAADLSIAAQPQGGVSARVRLPR